MHAECYGPASVYQPASPARYSGRIDVPGFPDSPFPSRPFFSCEKDEFAVIDSSSMASMLHGSAPEAWIRFMVGLDNVVESPPLKVLEHDGKKVRLKCRDAIVEIDFEDEAARKTSGTGGAFAYMGALDQANDGCGWIPVA